MSQIFIREIEKLKSHLVYMYKLVEENFTLSCRALIDGDQEAAETVYRKEREIDDKRVDLQEECYKLVALHQPVAFDLRFIMATLKFNNDLERIGDLALSIANRAQSLDKLSAVEPPFDVGEMADHVHSMLNRILDALVNLDQDLAVAVLADEDAVDAMHLDNLQRIKDEIRRSPDHIDALINYLSVSRYLERIADYTTNLAEEVIYIVEGEIVYHLHQDE